jgi:AcrR family transcriptional regulator
MISPAASGPAVVDGRRRGRPPGQGNTRQAVLDAARRVFAARGYDAASLRVIAAEAGVDPGMVRHFFGNKAGLFREALEIPVDFETIIPAVLAGGLDGVGERLIRMFLTVWDTMPDRSPLVALIRSAVSHEDSARMIREFISEQLLARVAAALDRPDPQLRAAFVGSQMAGLIMIRYIIRVEPLASADPEAVVAAVAPTIQRYLTGDLA